MPRILIVSQSEDMHAFLVAEALERKGAQVLFCHTPDFPSTLSQSLELRDGVFQLGLRGPEIDAACLDVDTVWWRRPSAPVLAQDLDPEDQAFARQESLHFYKAFWHFSAARGDEAPGAFPLWVNPVSAATAAEHKPLQQRAALDTVLDVPETLYGNDPAAIRAFVRRQGGQCVYKLFRCRNNHWRQSDGSYRFATTTVLTEQTLPDDDDVLRACPGIFQQLVAKRHELRVTVLGERVFAAKLDSQATRHGQLDWRHAYDELVVEPVELPAEIEAACVRIVRRLGLVFGALDLIVTPDGRYVFLEVNESGNFLWVEAMGGPSLLDPFCELLLQARRDFAWPGRGPRVTREQVHAAALRRMREAEGRHQSAPVSDSVAHLRRVRPQEAAAAPSS